VRQLPIRPFIKSALVAGAIGLLSFLNLADKINGFTSNLSEKDRLVRWSTALSGATRNAIPVTLIDIDDAVMSKVGAHARTPRDLIAGLLALASEKKAAGLFLDIDTSRPGESATADKQLRLYLESYSADAPPLGLARRVRDIRAGNGEFATDASILDGAVSGHPNILWVSSITRPDADQVVRRWTLSQSFCTGPAGETLASPQLMAAAIMSGRAKPMDDIRMFLDAETRTNCQAAAGVGVEWPRNPDPSAAIPFLFEDGPRGFSSETIERGGGPIRLFRRVSAAVFTGDKGELVAPAAIADELLKDRFVIIGASHAESMDGHATPVGFLPGSLIVANAVASAPAILSARPLGPVGATLIALACFGGLTLVTRHLRALPAGMVVAFSVLALLMLLGRIFAPSTASDIVLSAFSMLAIFSLAEGFYSIGKDWRVQGWRACLKPTRARRSRTSEEIT
jgi:CHASE2 domain-containing sensor protein